MFISRTTREERVTIETALDSAFLKIDQAGKLLYDLLEDYFGDREQKKLTDYDTETIGYRLWIVSDILSDSVLEYHLQTGHYDAQGVKGYIESAERAKANADAVRAQKERLHHDQKAG
jgi:hypothetical protein